MKYRCCFPDDSIAKKFQKVISQISQVATQDAIMQAIEKLADNPRPFGTKPFKQLKPPIQCYQFTAQYRLRIGDYRVLYDVDDGRKIVWILVLRKRTEATYKF
jgi:mRNA interferase RelE/StbE